MPAPLFVKINYGRTESITCVQPDSVNREDFHDLLDEFLNAYENGKVHRTGDFRNEFSLSPCDVHDFRSFSVVPVGKIRRDEAVVTVPDGTDDLPDVKTPSGAIVGAKVVSPKAEKRIRENSDVKEDDTIIAHLHQEESSVDDPSARHILRWWAESMF